MPLSIRSDDVYALSTVVQSIQNPLEADLFDWC